MEYELARRIGVPAERIIFNGPLKQELELQQALLEGAHVNLDSPDELETATAIAAQHPESRFSLGLRCNLDLGEARISRFGFDSSSRDLDSAVKRLRSTPNIELRRLALSFEHRRRSVESYRLRTERLLQLADRYFPEVPPKFLDVGGGF